MRYGLIGEKLGHSFSKDIHERIADYTFDLIPLSKEEGVYCIECNHPLQEGCHPLPG